MNVDYRWALCVRRHHLMLCLALEGLDVGFNVLGIFYLGAIAKAISDLLQEVNCGFLDVKIVSYF